jgi:uncharacterized damage-inducible protein DinB
MMDNKSFVETWQIQNRINLYLLDSIKEEYLADTLSSKGRNVGSQFAHLHNVRLMWLKAADPALFATQQKIETDTVLTKKLLADELSKSGEAIAALLEKGFESGKIKNFKPHAAAFFGYMIAHESHHRGQIILALKQSKHPVDKSIQYGIWEWGVR